MGDNRQTVEFYESQCAVCYVPMWQTRGGRLRRTCSAACRQKLYRLRKGKAPRKSTAPGVQAAAPKATRARVRATCPVCGERLVQPPTGRKRKTCSARCRKRLWRRQHPRCLMCGKRFTMARHQKEQKYCSKHCQWRALKLRQRLAKRERAIAEAAVYWPEWMPTRGTGYREERIPWEGEEDEAVIRKRKPHPHYRVTPEEREAERKAAEEEQEAAWRAEAAAYREELARKRRAEQLWYDLLVDESKWREW